MGDWSGTVPQILAGDIPTGDQWQSVTDELAAVSDAWSTWIPTLTNLTLGSGTVTARYRRVGKTVNFRFKFLLGAGSAVGTSPQFTLPAAPSTIAHTAGVDHVGEGSHTDSATAQYKAIVKFVSSSTVQIDSFGTTGVVATTSATVPFTWGSGDSMECWGTYETA